MVRIVILAFLCLICGRLDVVCQVTQPIVAVHDSELTRALEAMPAVAPTPTGSGTTGKQWWPTDWHYFVMPESLKEAFRSDGTAFTVVGDSNVTSGVLLTNGQPRYPIVITLAAEALRDDEIAPLTNYVAAGGFLFVGSSAFTRATNGSPRLGFAFGSALGLQLNRPGLTNWGQNNTVSKVVNHRLVSHIPTGSLTWRLPSGSEEISWGISPSHPFVAPHDIWQVQAIDATVLLECDTGPFLTIKQYGKGYFIWCAAFQPLVGHGGFAPAMYSYMIFRKAVEWAFESAGLPIPKLSPWPYQYDSAFMVRHDLENFTNEVAAIEASAQVEFTNNAKGDYYFCTGTLRDDALLPGYNTNAIVASLRRAVTNYGASIGPHNGGLKNPNNSSLARGDYDYWHWALDEALDVSPPPSGYASGKAYALASLSISFANIESWLAGTSNNSGLRNWCAPYFNSTREDSYDIQAQLNVKIAGEQKIGFFPHWTLSTLTPNKRYSFLTEPVSDWFIVDPNTQQGLVAQSLEPWHPPGVQTSQSLHDAIDFYYNSGALVNFYSHTLSTGLGPAGALMPDYLTYCANTNLHPRFWPANAVGVYQWWLQRSNAQVQVNLTTNGNQYFLAASISGSTHSNSAVEFQFSTLASICAFQITTNGVAAGPSAYRTNSQTVKVNVGTSITNVVLSYYPQIVVTQAFAEAFDGVTAPALPAGWTTSASGAQSVWFTTNSLSDSAPNAVFSRDATAVGINELVSPSIGLPVGTAQIAFRNQYDLEAGSGNVAYDGGVLELKIGTNAFADIVALGGNFLTGGYTSLVPTNGPNPLAGRQAWSGNSGGFVTTLANLPASASGQTVQFRWRCGTDTNGAASGWRIDTVSVAASICMCCNSPNTAPTLPVQTNRTIAESTTLVVTNTGSDADLPANLLNYSLLSPPAGAVIDSAGVITWTPSESQGPSTNLLTTVVTDNGFPPMSATNSFTVIVTEVNTAPVLPAQTNRTIAELTTLNVNNHATDTDLPANTLSYSLVNPPAGAAISSSGIITWTPSEAQGPSTNLFTTIVTDNASPPLSATNSFTVIVTEVNQAPTLPAQTNRTIASSTFLQVTNTATDVDIPVNTLTYSLPTAPAGAVISSTGIITWTPAQNHTTNLFRTIVTDNGVPPLSATNSFTIIVNDDAVVVYNSSSILVEGCSPTNNAIDAGETVTMLFTFKNTGLGNTTNLTATLLATNGVVSPSAAQSYGALLGGGAAVSAPFTFSAGTNCGSILSATFLLQDGAANLGMILVPLNVGQLTTFFSENFDSVTTPALPAGWTTFSGGAQANWRTTNSLSQSAPNAVFSADGANIGTNELVSPVVNLPATTSQLSFSNFYNLETGVGTNGYDGGVLEIKIGTNAFTDIIAAGGAFVSGGYNSTIDTKFGNPLAGRDAWSGTNTGYVSTIVNMPTSAANKPIQLRWRCGTDNGNGGGGWRIDNITISGYACCANFGPVLPVQTNCTVLELSPLIVTNTAADDPANTLTYALVAPPGGASIDTNGIITWTPSEAQGPGTNTITTIVTDNGVPPLSATNSFTVIVTEVNSAPVLPTQTNQTVAELTPLTVTNTATDSDLPANALSYVLVNPPAGVTIDTNGVIRWTPGEAQGPSTNTITTVVTDNGMPSMSATNSFTVIVTEVNSAPVLPNQTNQTVVELTPLTVTNTASDSDLPANALSYVLVNAPGGATIDTNGVIRWTPSEAQGPSTNTITTVVTDNGVPPLSATNSFTVIVTEVNSAPVLPAQTNQTVAELTPLIVTNTASDSDLPANALSYVLVNPPGGVTIGTNGVIKWTPGEAQGPSTNTITTVVTDNGVPPLSATNSFTVIVTEVNSAPVLPAQTNQTVAELTPLIVTNTASDSDLPANLLSYVLVNPPAGATIDTNGVIKWTPSEAQGPSTNTITTVVTDNGLPPLGATNSFTAIVTEVNSAPVLPVQADRFLSSGQTLVITNSATDSDLPANGLSYSLLQAPSGATISSNGVITWVPPPSQSGQDTNRFTTVVIDDGFPPLAATNSFNAFVAAPPPAPSILSLSLKNQQAIVTWSSVSGVVYEVQYKTNVTDPAWEDILPGIQATSNTSAATNDTDGASSRFYRVILVP